jgi:transposase
MMRSRFLLRVLGGEPIAVVAREFGVARETVRRWHDRLLREGPDSLLHERPGRGRRPGRTPSVVAAVVAAATQPPTWTLRQIAAHVGTSLATTQRICREHEHRVQRRLAPEATAPGAMADL